MSCSPIRGSTCSQAEVFGEQQPGAEQIPGDLICQQLPNSAFEAARVGGPRHTTLFGVLSLYLL